MGDENDTYKLLHFTLYRYANRAKNIKNKPIINEDPKDALLREFQEELLRQSLEWFNSCYYRIVQVEECSGEAQEEGIQETPQESTRGRQRGRER